MTSASVSQAFPTFNHPALSFDAFELIDSLSEPLAKARALVEIALSDHFLESSSTTRFYYLSLLDDILKELENIQKDFTKKS
jgi:hypothetical protein